MPETTPTSVLPAIISLSEATIAGACNLVEEAREARLAVGKDFTRGDLVRSFAVFVEEQAREALSQAFRSDPTNARLLCHVHRFKPSELEDIGVAAMMLLDPKSNASMRQRVTIAAQAIAISVTARGFRF